MNLRQLDIVLVDFGDDVIGSEQGGVRPALVIQNDTGNTFSRTTIVMPFTSNTRKKRFQKTHVYFKCSPKLGLLKDSILQGECIRQVSEQRIIKKLGRVCDAKLVEKIRAAYYANMG